MRRLKGYIGALIVVMSLMGSILAGYALNINGTSAVINEYEKVTDVSGLYAHTDEKNYIEYNPASNYIGYTGKKAYENTVPTYGYTLKNITEGTIVITPSSQTITVNGVTHTGFPANYLQTPFICDKAFFEGGGTSIQFLGPANIITNIANTITITISNNTTTLLINNTTITLTDVYHNLVYWPYDGWDYIEISGAHAGNGNAINAYLNSVNDVLSAGNDGTEYTSAGTTKYYRSINTTGTLQLDTIPKTTIDGDVFQMNINYNLGSAAAWGLYYPRYAYADTIGVDYTKSNRVNNYPFEYEHSEIINTYEKQINLKTLSMTNYWPKQTNNYQYSWQVGGSYTQALDPYRTTGGETYKSVTIDGFYNAGGFASAELEIFAKYKISDILSTQTLPANTRTVTLSTGTYTGQPVYVNDSKIFNNGMERTDATLPKNMVAIVSSLVDSRLVNMLNLGYGYEARCNLSTGLVEIYTTNGVKISTSTIDDTYIQFSKGGNFGGQIGTITGTTTDNRTISLATAPGGSWREYENGSHMVNNPYLDMTYTTAGSADSVYYMDIAKGISIKPTSQSVTWDNEYENGDIKLVFRAEETTQTYSNTFTVSNNNISVQYTGQHYYVSLNGSEAMDIGMWRSIVLDIDLRNGELYAIPVRTFNSFSNVQMDNTRIYIGDMVNAAPTNIIVWGNTPDSLKFGVYSTDVFLDTYGVVMVNPSLNITDYFTNLDNFYRLKLSNFSIFGQSMTVNGITGTVTGDSITFNDETVKIKEMNITYADGHAYVNDSHTSIDLGTIASNVVSMAGSWYFHTELQKGFTENVMVYTWDWNGFIFDNVQFVVFYLGLAAVGLIVGRRYATMTIIDYVVWGISIIIAMSIQVIA